MEKDNLEKETAEQIQLLRGHIWKKNNSEQGVFETRQF